MADIFISYKREDLFMAKDIADKLIKLGLSVWWDRNIPVGKAYDQVIEEELTKAKCIIVLWTVRSVTSLNVKEEALAGLNRNILIPVAVGNIQLPYGFKMIHTLYWNDNAEIEEEEFHELTNQLSRLIAPVHNNIVEPEKVRAPNQETDATEKLKPATLHFIKPNAATAVIHSIVSMKALESSVKIYLDGEHVGKMLSNEQFTLSIKPGSHFIEVRGGGAFYGASEKISVKSNEVLTLRIGNSLTGGLKLSRV